MMHQKALLFDYHETASEIIQETSPMRTQALGRKVKDFNKELWVQSRDKIVEEGSYYEFKHSLLKIGYWALGLGTRMLRRIERSGG
jgi:predicted NAD-dependent protein-ADP-ribosyltransferase YbiA (DUF1768 family)